MCSISAVRFRLPVHIFKALMMDCFSCVSFSGKRKIFSFSSSIYVQTSRFDYRLFGQQDGSFDLVLQFPYISRPAV